MVRGSFPKLTAAQIVEVLKEDFAVIVPPKLKASILALRPEDLSACPAEVLRVTFDALLVGALDLTEEQLNVPAEFLGQRAAHESTTPSMLMSRQVKWTYVYLLRAAEHIRSVCPPVAISSVVSPYEDTKRTRMLVSALINYIRYKYIVLTQPKISSIEQMRADEEDMLIETQEKVERSRRALLDVEATREKLKPALTKVKHDRDVLDEELRTLGQTKEALTTSIEEHERVKAELTAESSERRQVIEAKKEELKHVTSLVVENPEKVVEKHKKSEEREAALRRTLDEKLAKLSAVRERTSDWRETNGRFGGLMKKARGIRADRAKMEETLRTLEDRRTNDADISAVMRDAGKLKEEAAHRIAKLNAQRQAFSAKEAEPNPQHEARMNDLLSRVSEREKRLAREAQAWKAELGELNGKKRTAEEQRRMAEKRAKHDRVARAKLVELGKRFVAEFTAALPGEGQTVSAQ
ncbi:hypothetical protein FOZ61_005966 [Perkinsus olseni]|uniref:Uncharacterized protein n=1 Tax=Perkinsus olseni TaxID=32597 RepID=A0A7J6MS71_PEROL|nr:hypothetical protein FOZ61_005966 [Perkinsus olseni]KAF4674435.1 hypothetical protein FOL46_004997 [Perkinsus olseni]